MDIQGPLFLWSFRLASQCLTASRSTLHLVLGKHKSSFSLINIRRAGIVGIVGTGVALALPVLTVAISMGPRIIEHAEKFHLVFLLCMATILHSPVVDCAMYMIVLCCLKFTCVSWLIDAGVEYFVCQQHTFIVVLHSSYSSFITSIVAKYAVFLDTLFL